MTVDEPAFQTLMKEQRERARAARSSDETAWAGLDLGLDNLPTKFTGYERLHDDCTILAIVAEDELRERVGSGVHASIVLDKTPFYAEMGGQSADMACSFSRTLSLRCTMCRRTRPARCCTTV